MSNIHKIEVTIFNQTFEILSSKVNEEHLRELAHFVDLRMKETFKSTNLSSVLKVAVLTALNLAEELTHKSGHQDSHTNSLKEAELADTILKISSRIDYITECIEIYEEKKGAPL